MINLSDTQFEYYDANDDDWGIKYGAYWGCQTFTLGSVGGGGNHNITSVKLKLYRQGSPGTITIGIRAVDANHKPTGADLTSGTTNGNTLTTSSAGEWREITLTSYELTDATEYAIVFRAPDGNSTNRFFIRRDETSSAYTDGGFGNSSNSGSTWFDISTTIDAIFYEYGLAGGAELTHTCSDTMTISDSISTVSVMKFAKADTMTIGDVIATVSAMKHAAVDTMDISDVGGVIASLQMKIALTDQMDISDSAVFVLSEAEIAAIRRLRMIYGLKPARVPKIGHIGV